MGKTNYIENQWLKIEQARKEGFTDEEIDLAFDIAWNNRKMSYFLTSDLDEARSEINNKFRDK